MHLHTSQDRLGQGTTRRAASLRRLPSWQLQQSFGGRGLVGLGGLVGLVVDVSVVFHFMLPGCEYVACFASLQHHGRVAQGQ